MYKLSNSSNASWLFDLLLLLGEAGGKRRKRRKISQLRLFLVAGSLRDGEGGVGMLRLIVLGGSRKNVLWFGGRIILLASQIDLKFGDPWLIDENSASQVLHEVLCGSAAWIGFAGTAVSLDVHVVADPHELLLSICHRYYNCRQP